jgi:hypothetical protein
MREARHVLVLSAGAWDRNSQWAALRRAGSETMRELTK